MSSWSHRLPVRYDTKTTAKNQKNFLMKLGGGVKVSFLYLIVVIRDLNPCIDHLNVETVL